MMILHFLIKKCMIDPENNVFINHNFCFIQVKQIRLRVKFLPKNQYSNNFLHQSKIKNKI